MKNLFLSMAAVATFVSSSVVFADNANNNGYFTTKSPSIKNIAKATMVHPTEIIINNATPNIIYAYVPAAGTTDLIYPRDNDHIMNYSAPYYVRVVLKDRYGDTFYDAPLCPHASVTVYGDDFYDVRVDDKACDNHFN